MAEFDEQYLALLTAWDEALASGTAARLSRVEVPPVHQKNFYADRELLGRLQRLRPKALGAELKVPSTESEHSVLSTQSSALRTTPELPATLGRFQIRRRLGQGGFGVVYLAYDPHLAREVALKIPVLEALANAEVRARFQQEARAAALLDHPNVVPVYEAGEVGPICYLAAAYCPGTTLAGWLRKRTEPVPWDHAARLIATLADALQHAHGRGVLHRDLKPANILLSTESKVLCTESAGTILSTQPSALSTLIPRITDFGLAKLLDQDPFGAGFRTGSGAMLGTPAYMAPEQAGGRGRDITTAVDVYALGAILYELLTGRPPFQEATVLETLDKVRSLDPSPPRRFRPGLPRDLEIICLKCLHKEPERRYLSAHALAEDLRRFLGGEPVQARTAGRLERGWRWCRRNPALAATSGLTVGLLGVLALGAALATFSLAEKHDLALAHLHRADEADRARQIQLAHAYGEQARAKRLSNQTGQRFESLNRLDEALAIFRSLGVDHDYQDALRNEVIACLAYGDLRLAKKWPVPLRLPSCAVLDRSLERYAFQEDSGTILVRRFADNQVLRTLPGPPEKRCRFMQFSRDGRYLVAKQQDGPSSAGSTVQVWDLQAGEPIFRVLLEVANVAIDFGPDSKSLAVADRHGDIRLYDVATGRETRKLTCQGVPFRLAFDASGRRLAAALHEQRLVQIHSLQTDLSAVSLEHSDEVLALAWAPDGRRLACACGPEVVLWDTQTLKRVGRLQRHEGTVDDLAFSNSGKLLASGGWDGFVRLWEVQTGRQVAHCRGHYRYALGFSPDDRHLGLAWEDRDSLGVWEIAASRELRCLEAGQAATGVDFSPDGQVLVVATTQGLQVWDWSRLTRLTTLPAGFCRWTAFTSDGTSLLAVGTGGLQQWSVRSRAPTIQFGSPTFLWRSAPLNRGCLIPQGLVAASCNQTSQIGVWDLKRSSQPVWLKVHAGACFVACSTDKRWVASGAWSGSGVKIWDPTTGNLLHELPCAGSTNVAFSPDSKTLVTTTGEDFSFWQTGTWQLRRSIPRAHRADVPGYMAFTSDGRILAVNHSRDLIKLIDCASGTDLALLESPGRQEVSWLCFHPDGSKLAVVCNEQVLLWDLALIRRQLAERGLDWNLPP
jgi:eukaryotic-like serine/threonine-protein kinase